MARVLDDLVPIPGTRFRFGADALLGLVPGAGDAVTGAVAGYAIIVAARLGAPPVVLARMVLNVLVDALVGTVPLVGDLFDVGFRANRRNVRLAERYAAEPRRVRRSSRAVVFALLALLASVLVGVFVLLGWLLSGVADVLNRIAA